MAQGLDVARSTTAAARASGWTGLAAGLCWVQGLYFLATGVWPLVSIETFQAVTGPKSDNWTGREADHWLVNTVAALVIAVALPLLVAAWRRRVGLEVLVLAVGGAVALTAIDVVYAARGVIAPIYLADAAAEVVLLVGWACAAVGMRR